MQSLDSVCNLWAWHGLSWHGPDRSDQGVMDRIVLYRRDSLLVVVRVNIVWVLAFYSRVG